MDKLSLYELLSIIAPGYLFVELFDLLCQTYFGFDSSLFAFRDSSSRDISVIGLSILSGFALHYFHNWVIEKSKWKPYVTWMRPTIKNMVPIDPDLVELMPQIQALHAKKCQPTAENSQLSEGALFDLAYYYLEAEDKITQAKNFQSFYFLFRNVWVVNLIFLLIHAGILMWALCDGVGNAYVPPLVFVAIQLVFVFLLRWIAIESRFKMIQRIFRTYHICLLHTK